VSQFEIRTLDAGSLRRDLPAMLSDMDTQKTTLERAFDMARTGGDERLSDLIGRLNREGYDGRQVQGPILKRQLSNLIKEAKIARANRS